MLAAALNIHWSQRVTNKELYNVLPKITETTRYRWLTFSGLISTHDEEIAHNFLFCMPTNGKKQKRKATENIYWLTYWIHRTTDGKTKNFDGQQRRVEIIHQQ